MPLVGTTVLGQLNKMSLLVFLVGCVLIGLLALAAPRRPRVPQLFFLTLAVFLMSNKVWSPQYVIWLVPLVVLARPRLWSYALWQLTEVGYFFAIWAYLITVSVAGQASVGIGGIGTGVYFAALLARFGAILLLCGLVVKDILRPDTDVVRAAGEDDPAGGVLSGAPDRRRLRLGARRLAAAGPAAPPEPATVRPGDPAQPRQAGSSAGAEVAAEPADVGARVMRLADDRRTGGADHVDQ